VRDGDGYLEITRLESWSVRPGKDFEKEKIQTYPTVGQDFLNLKFCVCKLVMGRIKE
jgi:hypothetical protein